MPSFRPRLVLSSIAFLLATACAGASHGSAPKDHVTPPVRYRGDAGPNILEPVKLHIEVLVQADGTPDMRTLKVSGQGAGSAHAAVESWIRDSMFKPGTRNGVAEAMVMKMDIASQLVRR